MRESLPWRSTSAVVDRRARVAAQCVVRELELVALADEEAERPLAVARRLGRVREAAGEQLAAPPRARRAVVVAARRAAARISVAVDAELVQPALDPLRAPAVEIAAVLGEALGERGIVEIAALEQRGDDLLDERGLDPLAREVAPDLGLRAVAWPRKRQATSNASSRALLQARASGSRRARTRQERSGGPAAAQAAAAAAGSGSGTPLTAAAHQGRGGRRVAVDRRHEVLADAERLVDLALDLLGHLGMLVQVALGVVAALAEPLAAVGEERAGLGDDRVLDPEVQDAARASRCPCRTRCRTRPGGTARATLFLTTFTRTRLPTASVPSLSVSIRRMSRRCDE